MKLNAMFAALGLVVLVVFLAVSGVVDGQICVRNVGCGVADADGLAVRSWDSSGR